MTWVATSRFEPAQCNLRRPEIDCLVLRSIFAFDPLQTYVEALKLLLHLVTTFLLCIRDRFVNFLKPLAVGSEVVILSQIIR